MAVADVAQTRIEANLIAAQGAAWNLVLYVEGADLSGAYTCDVRVSQAEDATLVCEPTVTASYDSGTATTTLTWTLAKATADDVAVGTYYYDIRETTSGDVPVYGRVKIQRTVTP